MGRETEVSPAWVSASTRVSGLSVSRREGVCVCVCVYVGPWFFRKKRGGTEHSGCSSDRPSLSAGEPPGAPTPHHSTASRVCIRRDREGTTAPLSQACRCQHAPVWRRFNQRAVQRLVSRLQKLVTVLGMCCRIRRAVGNGGGVERGRRQNMVGVHRGRVCSHPPPRWQRRSKLGSVFML